MPSNVASHFTTRIQQWRKRHARGDVIVVRYADDVVVGFQYQSDATRFRMELDVRLGKFALELNPEKTRLLEFGRYAAERRAKSDVGKPETFDFLGVTHICGKTRAGDYLLVRHTLRKRMAAKLRWVRDELMRRRHLSIKKQGLWLQRVVGGYFNYHAMPTNIWALQQFRKEVTRHWLRALRQRSQKDRTSWLRITLLVDRWLPAAAGAAGSCESMSENATAQVGAEVALDPRGDAAPHGVRLGGLCEEGLEVVLD